MSIQRTYYCEGPDCGSEGVPRNVTSASPPPYIPGGFIETRSTGDNGEYVHHFCGWDCLMKFAADQPQEEVISWNPTEGTPDV